MKTLLSLLLITTLAFPMERFIGMGGSGLVKNEHLEVGWTASIWHQAGRFSFPVEMGVFNGGFDFTLLAGARGYFNKECSGLSVGLDIGGVNFEKWDWAVIPNMGSRRNLLFKALFVDLNGAYEIVEGIIVLRASVGVKL